MALSLVPKEVEKGAVGYTTLGKEVSIEPLGNPPNRLDKHERRIWNRIMKEAGAGLVQADRELLAQYCICAARTKTLQEEVKQHGEHFVNAAGNPTRTPASVALDKAEANCKGYLLALGLTPSARARAPVVR